MGYYAYNKVGSYVTGSTLGTTGYAHYYYTSNGGISYSYPSSIYGSYGSYGSGGGAYTGYGSGSYYASSPYGQSYGSSY